MLRLLDQTSYIPDPADFTITSNATTARKVASRPVADHAVRVQLRYPTTAIFRPADRDRDRRVRMQRAHPRSTANSASDV